ncbi:MAG: hypothetical protein U0L26_00975 [Cellulosilyticum sp.]|nr:hypothetical protein [Cellulosilyticum sp.]
MEYIKLYTLATNQAVIATNSQRRFYSYDTLICVYDYDTKEFSLSENESHFTKTTVKWLNRFLVGYDTTYQDIKKTARRENLN